MKWKGFEKFMAYKFKDESGTNEFGRISFLSSQAHLMGRLKIDVLASCYLWMLFNKRENVGSYVEERC